jgi:hypothetical protein
VRTAIGISLLAAACIAAFVLTPAADHTPHPQPVQTFSRAFSGPLDESFEVRWPHGVR